MRPTHHVGMTSSFLVSTLGINKVPIKSDNHTGTNLKFDHRYSDRIACPLGEIPWPQLGIEEYGQLDSDALMHKGSMIVLDQLLQQSRLKQRYKNDELAFAVGTTTSGISAYINQSMQNKGLHREFTCGSLHRDMAPAHLGHVLAENLGLNHLVFTFGASCAASAQGLAFLYDLIQSGTVKAGVLLGIDVLNLITILGFDALQILDHNYCQPFTAERAGINLGEAIVGIVLERVDYLDDGPCILGYGHVSESAHMTQTEKSGRWMVKAMSDAMKPLAPLPVKPSDISYINPHGTGTDANDTAEIKAITQVFDSISLAHPSKKLTGHTLGASGALEAVITIANLNAMAHSRSEKKIKMPLVGLNNSFGFGGVNMSFMFSRNSL